MIGVCLAFAFSWGSPAVSWVVLCVVLGVALAFMIRSFSMGGFRIWYLPVFVMSVVLFAFSALQVVFYVSS